MISGELSVGLFLPLGPRDANRRGLGGIGYLKKICFFDFEGLIIFEGFAGVFWVFLVDFGCY